MASGSLGKGLNGIGSTWNGKVRGIVYVDRCDILQADVPARFVTSVEGRRGAAGTRTKRYAPGFQAGGDSAAGLAGCAEHEDESIGIPIGVPIGIPRWILMMVHSLLLWVGCKLKVTGLIALNLDG
jgi:hypothetical protein